MADRVRSHRWESTSLGPIENWSKELVTVVNLTLCSPSPARTMWGPEFILIYNDAYRPIPGKRHPWALGKSSREVYKEAWHVVGPLLEHAFSTGETCYIEKLVVPLEADQGVRDFYLNYSFNPVYEDGRIAGLFGPIHDVTNEVTANTRLRESEARASRVLESIGDAVIVTDANACVSRINPVAQQLTGWTAEQAMDKPLTAVFRIVNEDTREPVENPADKVRRLGGAIVGMANHTLLLNRDGSETPVEDSCAPIYDDENRLTGMVLVFRDVRERRSGERQREVLSRQLDQVLGAITDGVLSIDRSWRMIYMNRSAEQILAPGGDLLGRNFWETFPKMIYPGSPCVLYYHRAMEQGIAGRFEEYYAEPLNAWFAVNAQPSPDGIILFFRDITEQRREAEELRESSARLRAMYSASLEYIGLLTTDGTILHSNDASLEFAGSRREDLLGLHYAAGPWWANTPGMPDLIRQWIVRVAGGESVRMEAQVVRPDGETMVFDFSLTPARNAAGEVIYLVPEARDITELKRAETALMQSEKLAAVGRLASSIAHEINNPLESVTNLIYLARMHVVDGESKRFLEMADQELGRISIIANQTLRFHRQPSNPRPVEAADLFATVLGIYEGRLRNSKIDVLTRLREAPPVTCFEGDIRQVLNNLVGNAIDAMPHGGRLFIRSREATEGKSGRKGLVLTVADTGEGMAPDVLKRIFEPFFTTKGMSGTGLGLWVSQEIVKRHKGTLHVRSSRNPAHSGTVFALFLPYDPAI
jgi:PAS domain S-box-containing protein